MDPKGTDVTTTKHVPLIHAAFALQRGYLATRDLVLRGKVKGFRDERGRWLVDAADLERAVREQEREQRSAGAVPA